MVSGICYLDDIERVVESCPPCPEGAFSGDGIVICAGGPIYTTSGWVLVKLLRKLGCDLPIEVWHRGRAEMSPRVVRVFEAEPGVRCVDAFAVAAAEGTPRPSGWETKPYAILHSSFERVLFIDCDNVPVRDPSFLLHCEPFLRLGSVFWPDRCMAEGDMHRTLSREAWDACGVPWRDEPEVESGQMVIDKRRCWTALQLAMFLNERSDFFYRHMLGDKDTFHLAWRRVGQDYAMPGRGPDQDGLNGPVLYQHDFEGNRLFQHRNQDKWRYEGGNDRIPGFVHEDFCLEAVKELRGLWDGVVRRYPDDYTPAERSACERITCNRLYHYDWEEAGARLLEFRPDFSLGIGKGRWETHWEVEEIEDGTVRLALTSPLRTLGMLAQSNGGWKGTCLHYARAPMSLVPITYLADHERKVAEQIRDALDRLPAQEGEEVDRIRRTRTFACVRPDGVTALDLLPDHTVGRGDAAWWYVEGANGSTRLVLCGADGPTHRFVLQPSGEWQGSTVAVADEPVRLVPLGAEEGTAEADYYTLAAADYYAMEATGYYAAEALSYYV